MMLTREQDACGVGFVADVRGQRSHTILRHAVTAVANLGHRGAIAADGKTGDGAGVLTQLPYALLRRDLAVPVPDDHVAVGMLFLPAPAPDRTRAMALVETAIAEVNLRCIGWRNVPMDPAALGAHARATQPHVAQVVVHRSGSLPDDAFDRSLYLCRRRIERRAAEAGLALYVPSFSRRTIVYKALLSSPWLARFYPDLSDPAYETALAVFHQRYSTNTFPSWSLAQPFRFLAHNGEINTLQGNDTWMRAREPELQASVWGDCLPELLPVIQDGGSDSAMLDNVVELLVESGRALPHVLSMLVPAAWETDTEFDERVRGFYEYHTCLTEPWDGPAALAFSDGTLVGATLDRNGLRPARFARTDDGLVVMASEVGVLDLPPERVVEKGRLGPGQMLVVDTAQHLVLHDHEVKAAHARVQPYAEWVRHHLVELGDGSPNGAGGEATSAYQRAFGFTVEDVERILRPMVQEGKDPVFSMGDDIPPAVLSSRPRLLYQYFRQRFAQVTNPPVDPLRERAVMSLSVYLGPRRSFLEESAQHARLLRVRSPILLPYDLRWLHEQGPFPTRTLPARFCAAEGAAGLARALQMLIEGAMEAARSNALIVLSDRGVDAEWAPVPMLLAVSAVHHELIRRGLRMRTSIIADTGEARDIHQFACLIGYGASAVCPYLALQTLAADTHIGGDVHSRWAAYRKACDAGLLKIMSKMGISTLTAYCGAQIFEAVGLDSNFVERHFAGTPSRIEGIGLAEIAAEAVKRHQAAFAMPQERLAEAGLVRFRRDGEYHAFNPYVIKAMHRAMRNGDAVAQGTLVDLIASRPPTALRDLLEFVPQHPVPVAEVEPVEAILRRFVISAMSHGALGREAHEALATAANRVGARSSSGEGGEDPRRYRGEANSRIKQIASARFGVTPEYILSADELEIKMAQGSKPGEGGQLPGHKVSAEIAQIRRAQSGSTLISPPPHHDIYSIEDLAQLIYDLKRIHPRARVGVKLVAESGVGTIAAGVAKAFADTIQISGHDGGTGASPLDSIKNAGVPWELGLAETQQVLVRNDLRGRVRLRVDGGLKIGRDIAIAALLGADEFGFGTAAVVALGCVMARQCHLNTCPVGIATQDETLRAKFSGTPEMVIAYLTSVAAQVREILAALGARSLQEIIGRVDLLRPKSTDHPKAARLNLDFVLGDPDPSTTRPRRNEMPRNDRHDDVNLDVRIVADVSEALRQGRSVRLRYPIRNAHRTVGARLAGVLAEMHGDAGLPEGSVTIELVGAAGQSFGAFCVPGMTLLLVGEANDYVGKGMAGGEIVIRPPRTFVPATHRNVILGNTVLYGATGGRLFAAGRAGERFAVRNSGAIAVVEGVGDHGCEYMTGGVVVVLGEVGRNFVAGMTGGVAYVLDEQQVLPARCNPDHVRWERVDDRSDQASVHKLIVDHARLTRSQHAWTILQRWAAYSPLFWKIAPSSSTAKRQEALPAAVVADEPPAVHISLGGV
jgi:glutamate synthase domain-containing protein 2/glutamate synthase domain-containing protein 1/glutamate synthase domain-containing protein 3